MSIKEIGLPDEIVMNQIYLVRAQKVMLDRDLAILYGVETRVLKQAVRRNIDRFPEDFMFEVREEELDEMVSQSVIPDKKSFGGAKPFAFTEQGVAMLSSVLSSKQAIQVNIQIIRVFTKIRQLLTDNTELRLEIAEIKTILQKHAEMHTNQSKNIELVFNYLDELGEKKEQVTVERKEIGYKINKEKKTNSQNR
ncbi:ORF6N domain-containing protein [Pedobacter frigiditerrae]|uniref:ORF6N domain-containing protein n=1 Tax=Pedobacter frigiditerrae TaxID=2530452 RepID=A0A4R0N361_9SPHI|nr:ORF6N domain-containing protein [Pedobacter frigiditerrae]TCC94185.1 ORF6N domain-containing protein [Pedobacter frigiditerrae]